jgi:hypothetical protein
VTLTSEVLQQHHLQSQQLQNQQQQQLPQQQHQQHHVQVKKRRGSSKYSHSHQSNAAKRRNLGVDLHAASTVTAATTAVLVNDVQVRIFLAELGAVHTCEFAYKSAYESVYDLVPKVDCRQI